MIKGLKVHPENPFLFDFIVDPGNERLNPDDFKKTSQRLVNYFLASLAMPEKDLWVNLSPVEKNRIIPDALIKTELGRDLLAEDYMLKQISSSLIYPESGLGKEFWQKVYEEAYQKFGVTQIPVNTFNKVWILPQKASVYEKGDSVYIVNAHLKVMLEDDLLAQSKIGNRAGQGAQEFPVKDISKQVMRQVVLPIIEKEVNEDKNFAALRQVFYSLVLAQWYQDVFKQSVLNKIYAGQLKVAGIDVSDPRNKELIYRRYLSAYKKGVFNYIKEETDRVSQQPIPRKYFSGGFVDQQVLREPASVEDLAANAPGGDFAMSVVLNPSTQIESRLKWNDLNRPLEILTELKTYLKDGKFDREGLYAFIDKYSVQVASQRLYPVQGAWPVLKAITLLEKSEEEDLVQALLDKYPAGEDRPELVDKILLMNHMYASDRPLKDWLINRAPRIAGRMIYLASAEIHYWSGGLGPVMKFLGKGMKVLGASVGYAEPWYQLSTDGEPVDYESPDIGLKILDPNFMEYAVKVGDIDGINDRIVHVKAASAIDENGLPVYLYRDVQADGSSYYTRMLYNYQGGKIKKAQIGYTISQKLVEAGVLENVDKDYVRVSANLDQRTAEAQDIVNNMGGNFAEIWSVLHQYRKRNNPITQEESMAFLNIAAAELIKRLETKRKQDGGQNWKPAIVESEDGQFAPLQAVMLSQYPSIPEITKIFFAFKTHTFRNRGQSGLEWGINVFLKHMLKIKDFFITSFMHDNHIDYTSGGIRPAQRAFAVSDMHRDGVAGLDPNVDVIAATNGAVAEEMAKITRQEFAKLKQQGKIPQTADFERPTAQEVELTKIATKTRLNEAKIKRANGEYVHVDLDKPLEVVVLRLVEEKAGRDGPFSNYAIWEKVRLGYNIVYGGNHQGTDASEDIARELRELENQIDQQKREHPGEFPGNFQFVERFTRQQRLLILAAQNLQIQGSKRSTGAAEFSEADSTSNMGLNGGGTYREGVIVDQGIPALGQTLVPGEDTPESWVQTVYRPLMDAWNEDPVHHTAVYQREALSPRLNRIQNYLLTSAAELREINKVMEQEDRLELQSRRAQADIVQAIGGDIKTIRGILYEGRNGVERPFTFTVFGKGDFIAEGNDPQKRDRKGLIAFKKEMDFLEQKYGYDVLYHHFLDSHFQRYLEDLFDKTPAYQPLVDRINLLENDTSLSLQEKVKALEQFIDILIEGLKTELNKKPDAAMMPGGIKLDNIPIERHGHLTADVLSDKALESMYLNAQGLYGTIVGITPIANLIDFLR